MQKLFFVLFAAAIFSCDNKAENQNATTQATNTAQSENNAKANGKVTTIQWIDPQVRDMGKVNEGQEVEITWKFKNSGTEQLVIRNVSASCGCTIPETPKEPIAPGAEGVIKAKFASNNRPGMNHKQVTVHANTDPAQTVLSFNVEVIKKG